MDRIAPYLLWIGHAGDGGDGPRLFENGIRAVVQVALEEPPLKPPRELVYPRFPLVDGGGNGGPLLRLTIFTVANLIEARVPTLVCCGAGMSRSPAVAAAALAVVGGEPPEACLRRVLAGRRGDVSPGLWSEILGVLSPPAGGPGTHRPV